MSNSIDSENGDPSFQIAPMVDVVFVLLLFFMAMAGMQQMTRELEVQLPGRGTQSQPTAIIVEIAPTGEVLVNSLAIGGSTDKNLLKLRDWFQNLRQQFGTKDQVMIRPASNTVHERIVDVLNAVKAAGVDKVTFL